MTEEVKVFETPVMTITKTLVYHNNVHTILKEEFLVASWADVIYSQRMDYNFSFIDFLRTATKKYAEWLIDQVERLTQMR